MEILRLILTGTQFLLTLPNDFSTSSHSIQFEGAGGGVGEEDPLVKHRFSQILSLKCYLQTRNVSLLCQFMKGY